MIAGFPPALPRRIEKYKDKENLNDRNTKGKNNMGDEGL
jgi:hypothetical protein